MRVPSRLPIVPASRHGTPRDHATGANTQPKICCRLQARTEPPRMRVGQRNQRDERNQHRADVDRQLQALAGAAAGRVDHVDVGLLDLELDGAAASPAPPVSGTNIFAIINVPGAVMITAVSRCRGSMPNAM